MGTVLSARPWEEALVWLMRETAAVRLVLRAYEPTEVDRAEALDVLVAGAETPWVTPVRLEAWRRRGLRVVGVHPAGDRPARRTLVLGGADEVLPDDSSPELLLRTICLLRPRREPPAPRGILTVVTGPRGAPGRTEVALGLAWNRSAAGRTLLVDLDRPAPGLAVRLALPARPGLAEAVDALREDGTLPPESLAQVGPLDVLAARPHPVAPPSDTEAEEVVQAALSAYHHVVADSGPHRTGDSLLLAADQVVLVVGDGALGFVRAGVCASGWEGVIPSLVLNRVDPTERHLARTARRWLGLDPAAIIPEDRRIRAAAWANAPPHPLLRRALLPVEATPYQQAVPHWRR